MPDVVNYWSIDPCSSVISISLVSPTNNKIHHLYDLAFDESYYYKSLNDNLHHNFFEPDCLQSGSLRTILYQTRFSYARTVPKTRNCMLAHMQFSVARRRRRRRNRAFESTTVRFRHSRVSRARARVREARSDPVKTKTRKATKKPPKRQKVVEIETFLARERGGTW